MSSLTGIAGGALALATLQLVLSSPRATDAFGAVATVPAGWLEKIMDATVAAIPDHSAPAPPAAGQPSAAAPPSAIPPPSSLPPPTPSATLSV